jgi:NitT/TauT family transport system ATP-binding protein
MPPAAAPRESTEGLAQTGADLEVTNLVIEYPQRSGEILRVLDQISLSVRPGEFVSLLGPSGCGKSTLLRAIDGLVNVTAGTVTVNGTRVSEPGSDRAFVFQAHSLLPWQSVAENAALGLRMRGVSAKQARKDVQPLLELVGLHGFEGSFPRELSGGMQQRVNLARALAVDPDILLMDEPFAALDAQTRVVMQRELLRIWSASSHRSVVFVTHNVEEAIYLSDRVVVLSSKPAHVRDDIRIDIPRPRRPEVMRTPEFTNLVGQVWELIEAYVFAQHEGAGPRTSIQRSGEK